jgi:DNA-directed RNA polymerase subunit RPC12/RpoP
MDEKLEINCPICGDKHIYKLKVEKTYVAKLLTTKHLSKSSQPVTVTRIFVCPVKNQKFQASFTLYQTSSDKIKSVIVEGVIEGEAE